MPTDAPHPIILYDSVCGLCNRLVRFILKRDRRDVFRFAALQSDLAARILSRHGAHAEDLDTMYLVLDCAEPGERLLTRSDAAMNILPQLSRPWRITAALFKFLPRGLREWGYRMIARHRYRIFGKLDACPLPDPKTRGKFLDQRSPPTPEPQKSN